MRIPSKQMVLFLAVATAVAAPSASRADVAIETEDAKTLYALGVAMSRNLAVFSFDADEIAIVQAGLADGALGRELRVDLETYAARIDGMLRGRVEKRLEAEKEAGAAFRAKLAEKEGVVVTESGVLYEQISAGSGATPGKQDTVKIHYTGTLTDGTVFDTSRGGPVEEPAEFPLSGVIPCFAEGVGKMRVGGTSRIVCPPEAAYGDRGSPPNVPPGATLAFEVELLEIVPGAPETPSEP